jgi:hypothetical protein
VTPAAVIDLPPVMSKEANLPPLIAVPVKKVRFLQAMAEDGPGARPCRIDGCPVQQVIQHTIC